MPMGQGLAQGKRGSQRLFVANQETTTIKFLNANHSYVDLSKNLRKICFPELFMFPNVTGYIAMRYIEQRKGLLLIHFKGTKMFRFGILDIANWKLMGLTQVFRCENLNKMVKCGLLMFIRWINR